MGKTFTKRDTNKKRSTLRPSPKKKNKINANNYEQYEDLDKK